MVYSLAFYGVVLLGTVAALIFVALNLHYRLVDLRKSIASTQATLMRLHTHVYSRNYQSVDEPRAPFRPTVIKGPMTIRGDNGAEAKVLATIHPTVIK